MYISLQKTLYNILGDCAKIASKASLFRNIWKATGMKYRHSCISPWQYNHVIQRS